MSTAADITIAALTRPDRDDASPQRTRATPTAMDWEPADTVVTKVEEDEKPSSTNSTAIHFHSINGHERHPEELKVVKNAASQTHSSPTLPRPSSEQSFSTDARALASLVLDTEERDPSSPNSVSISGNIKGGSSRKRSHALTLQNGKSRSGASRKQETTSHLDEWEDDGNESTAEELPASAEIHGAESWGELPPTRVRTRSLPSPRGEGKRAQDPWIHDHLQRSSLKFHGYIQSSEAYRQYQDRYRAYFQHHRSVDADATLPRTEAEKVERVRQLYAAVVDWTRVDVGGGGGGGGHRPKRARNGRGVSAAGEGGDDDGRSGGEVDPDHRGDALFETLHIQLSDFEVELLCWRVLEAALVAQTGRLDVFHWSGMGETKWEEYETFGDRWLEICRHLSHCKQSLHSITRGTFTQRIANAPLFENKRKSGNRQGNDRKYQRLAQLIKVAAVVVQDQEKSETPEAAKETQN